MKLTNKQLDQGIYQIVDQIYKTCKLSPKQSYSVMLMHRKLEKAMKDAKEMFLKILKEHVELDEEGNILPANDENKQVWKFKEGMEEAYAKAMEEFMTIELEIDREPLDLDSLGNASLTPKELEILEPILKA